MIQKCWKCAGKFDSREVDTSVTVGLCMRCYDKFDAPEAKVAEPVFMKYRKRSNDHGTTFFGEDGWLSVDRGGIEASDPKFLSIHIKPTDTRLVASNSHAGNFLECIRTRQQPISNLEAAIRSDTISHMSDLTVRLGRPIHWDPAKEVVVNDDAANRMLHRAMRAPFVF